MKPGLAVFVCLAVPAAAAEYAGAPRVGNFTPRGWHRGSTVEVEFNGLALKDPRGILFTDTDKIRVLKTAEAAPPPRDNNNNNNNRPRRGGGREGNTRIVATLEIAPDCPQGQHSLRLQTAAGLTDLVLFNVGGLPTVQEVEDPRQQKTDENGTADTAQKIEFGSTVNGTLVTLPEGMEQDWFRVEAKKGQLISAEAECSRLCASGREDGFEALLTVRDAAGKILASADSQPLLLIDPFLAIAAPEDGAYYISVSAALPPENNRRIPYRLHAGEFRRPSAVYPAGGNPSEKLAVRLIGLPSGVSDKAEVTLPAKEGVFAFNVDDGTPTANPMRVLSGANVLEQEPNDSQETATAVTAGSTAPFALNGILEKPGDTDCFSFGAKKGERLNVRLYGQALGSPIDAGFTIAKAGSNSKANRAEDSNDDALGIFDGQTTRERLDPAEVWSAPEDGEYVLTVSDTRGKGGPDFVYRVEFTGVRDGLLTTLSPVDNNARQARDSVTVGRGNRAGVIIATKPLPGANVEGEYELVARGLPAGVKLVAPHFKASDRRVPVLFEAAADAAVSAAAVELIALPTDAEKAKTAGFGYNQSIPLVTLGNDPVWQVMVDKLSLAVAEDVPFTITAKAPASPLSKNSETTVEITLTRNNGYTGDVVVMLEQPPRGVNGQQNVVLTGDETKVDFRLSGEGGVQPGKYNLSFSARNREGNDRTGAGRIWAASAAVPLEVSDPWFRVKFARTRIERGKSGTMTGTIERLREFPGRATAALIRLPRGLSLTEPVALGETDKLSFQLQASDDALVGSYNGVACEIVVDNGGSPLKQIAGYGSLRVDPARKAE
ncbi:MAG TPA: PPC domain-containing protein [Verrucomicrobiales bacterium]|nr:PPC domain-containing protein [Verrucomicrobiales bacterium]